MSTSKNPCSMTEQAAGWALHALEPDEEIAVALHVPGCPTCQAVVRDAEEASARIGVAVEQVDPPPSLRAAIMDAVAVTPQETHQQPTMRPEETPARSLRGAGAPASPRWIVRGGRLASGSWWTRGRLVGASLALVAVLAIGGLAARTAQLQKERDIAATQAAAVTALVTQLDRPGVSHAMLANAGGNPVAAVLVEDGKSQVLPMGLSANPSDHTYVLWGLKAGVAPQPVGAFDVAGPDGVGLHAVGSGAGGYSGYAISLEPGHLPPATPSAVVANGQVRT